MGYSNTVTFGKIFFMLMSKSYRINKTATLPISLINDIEKSPFSTRIKDKIYSFIVNLNGAYIHETLSRSEEYTYMPKKFMQKHFGNDYISIRNYLEENKIIEINHRYFHSTTNANLSFCKSIKVNSLYYKASYSNANFYKDMCQTIPYSVPINTDKWDKSSQESTTIINLKSLRIDYNRLRIITEDVVNNLSASKFNIDEQIKKSYFSDVYFYDSKKSRKYGMRTAKALEKAKAKGVNLIQDGQKLYIMPIDKFLIMKGNLIRIAYNDSIDNLEKRAFYASRHETNDRLNSNITNMPSILFEEIMRQNRLVQLDLANSQFAILSHIYKNTDIGQKEDFKNFIHHSQNGKLYEYIMDNLDFESRKEAKQAMFELMFSSHKYRSPLKAKLRKLFPNVIKAVNTYKKENGSNQFAIMLQKFEANFFIDNLFKKINTKNRFVLTKHDSIIVAEKDLENAKKIAKKICEKVDFVGLFV